MDDSDAGCRSLIANEGTVLFTTTRFLPRNLDLCLLTTALGGLARKLLEDARSRDSGGRRSVAGPKVESGWTLLKVESGWTVGRKDSSGAEVSNVSAPRRRGSREPVNMNGFGEDGEAKNCSTKGARVLCPGSS